MWYIKVTLNNDTWPKEIEMSAETLEMLVYGQLSGATRRYMDGIEPFK